MSVEQTEKIVGHLYQTDYLHPPEFFCPDLRTLSLVVGSPVSDIGKGWTTAAIASLKDNPLVIKIDPMLKPDGFPMGIGVQRDGKVVTDDFVAYESLGLATNPKQNIVLGEFFSRFYQQRTPYLKPGVPKKMTTADVSSALAEEMLRQIKDSKAEHVVIEIGGIPTDMEHQILPAVFRFMELQTMVSPEIILLSTFDHTEDDVPKIKTQLVRQAIRDVREFYGFDFKSVLIRRRRLPVEDESCIEHEITTTAYETQVSRDKFLFVENVYSPGELADIFAKSTLFDQEEESLVVSSCAMGIPCRHDGEASNFSPEVGLELVSNPHVELFCPEVAAGLPTPRDGVEIIGAGGGEAVLNNRAKIENKKGEDFTQFFVSGAIALLRLCLENNIRKAYLTPRSPSCGVGVIYAGEFDGTLMVGNGVAAALLMRWGIECIPVKGLEPEELKRFKS